MGVGEAARVWFGDIANLSLRSRRSPVPFTLPTARSPAPSLASGAETVLQEDAGLSSPRGHQSAIESPVRADPAQVKASGPLVR